MTPIKDDNMATTMKTDNTILVNEPTNLCSELGIIKVAGKDSAGRRIIIISACNIPSKKTSDYARY